MPTSLVRTAGKSVNLNGNNGFISVPGFKQQLSDMTACSWAKFSSTYSGGGRQYLIDMRGDGSQNNGQNFYLIVDEVSRGKSVKGVASFGDGWLHERIDGRVVVCVVEGVTERIFD